MSRRQRFASTFAGPALVAAITFGLAACGGDSGSNSATPGVPPGVAPPAGNTAAPSPSADPAPAGTGGNDALPMPAGDAAQGAALAQSKGCMSCHQLDNDVVGPRWTGLWGSQVELEDGTTVLADEEYLRRAITDPDAERVAGYFVAMPKVDLTDDEVSALVAYIASLAG